MSITAMKIDSGSVRRIVDSSYLSRLDRHYIGRECEIIGPIDEPIRKIMHHDAVFAVRILGITDTPMLCRTCLQPIRYERFGSLAVIGHAANWFPKVRDIAGHPL
jgi:hypothetical protein